MKNKNIFLLLLITVILSSCAQEPPADGFVTVDVSSITVITEVVTTPEYDLQIGYNKVSHITDKIKAF